MNEDELRNRFAYHPPKTPERVSQHEEVRKQCLTFALLLNFLLPEGREKALAVTHLEEVMMWANASIARQSG
jgi:hypothetical protein